jgi:hypothetical protein
MAVHVGLAIVNSDVWSDIMGHEADHAFASYLLRDFVNCDYGEAYGIKRLDRQMLVERFERNNREIQSATSTPVHIVLAREILSIPPSVKGDVIECGVFKGASTASLSAVCHMVGRRLLVCDSFQGLPDEGMKLMVAPHFGIYGYYRKGMFCGSLEEVRENVSRFGKVEGCQFIPGFFAESLRQLSGPIVFGFLDVDLVSSTQDCLRYIWPLLVEGGKLYTDEAGDMDVVRVFFDDQWWRKNLRCKAPGYVGSGCGLALNPRYSATGYTQRISEFRPSDWQRVDFLCYPDQQA